MGNIPFQYATFDLYLNSESAQAKLRNIALTNLYASFELQNVVVNVLVELVEVGCRPLAMPDVLQSTTSTDQQTRFYMKNSYMALVLDTLFIIR